MRRHGIPYDEIRSTRAVMAFIFAETPPASTPASLFSVGAYC
jgi:hypothetical protein